jgi:ribosome-associated protein
MASIESYQLVLAAAAACEDKKAEDIRILALDPAESGLSDYFLICNGTNERQNVAITDEIEIRLKREFGVYPTSVEGRRQAEWILMDYTDFIVHVFSPEKRAFYGLERLRKSAKTISVAELNEEMKALITASRTKKPASKFPAKSDAASAPAKATAKKIAAKKSVAAKKPAVKSAAKKAAPKKAVVKKAVAKKAAKKSK